MVNNVHATIVRENLASQKDCAHYLLVVRDTADKDGGPRASCQYFGGVLSPG